MVVRVIDSNKSGIIQGACQIRVGTATVVVALVLFGVTIQQTEAFRSAALIRKHHSATTLYSDWKDGAEDSNQWAGLDDLMNTETDWQDMLNAKKDGSFWSNFEPSEEGEAENAAAKIAATSDDEEESEAWLDTLAALSAEEVEFNMKEADRADKVRQMEEWQFAPEVIASTLGVATNTELEADEVEGMSMYRQESYLDEVDLETVESHSMVERDEESGELVRTQMVYVDEHTCIGCTNCATIAQSTFFMHSEVSDQLISSISRANNTFVSLFLSAYSTDARASFNNGVTMMKLSKLLLKLAP